MRPEHLITAGALLCMVGGAMVWAAGAADRHRPGPARPARAPRARRVGAFACATLLGALITGLQWVLLGASAATVAAGPAWTAVLGVPAFLAAATLVRVALAIRTALARYRHRDHRARVRGVQR